MTQEKQRLVKEKEKQCVHPVIEPHEIVPLVTKAWYRSFARVKENQKAIAERGWNPYNRNTLTLTDVQATMTNEEIQEEENRTSVDVLPKKPATVDLTLAQKPTYDEKYLKKNVRKEHLDFKTGVAQLCLKELVHDQQLQEARASIKRDQDDGKSYKQRLFELKTISSGSIFLAGGNDIGKPIHQIKQETQNKKIDEKIQAVIKLQTDYEARKEKAYREVISKEPDYMKWNSKEMRMVNASIKYGRFDGGAIPTKLSAGRLKYMEWKDRPGPDFQQQISTLEKQKRVFKDNGKSIDNVNNNWIANPNVV